MTTKRKSLLSLSLLGGMLATGLIASPASAHGYVSGPISRSFACAQGLNTDCGAINYEPQSLEGPKGFPQAGPSDGQIASAGGLFGGILDQQTDKRWYKSDIPAGPLAITWNYTAAHKTSGWSYYMTKQGWDPNAPLSRSELEPIAHIDHDGSAASSYPTHVVDVPADRSGYHVILGVWDVADTDNAFYQVMDVNVSGQSAPDTQAPTTPTDVRSTQIGTTSVVLDWTASQDNTGVSQYQVLRDGQLVGTSSTTGYTDNSVSPGTRYSYRVRALDTAGNVSGESPALNVTTEATPDVDHQPPSAPQHLHSMGVTESSASLMWAAATDGVGVDHYLVFRNGEQVARTEKTMAKDTGLTPATAYTYTVRAVDAAGNISAKSHELTITTAGFVLPGVEAWDSRGAYRIGDRVTYQGSTYECIQGYQGFGDPNWILAPSLWKKV